MQGPQFYSTRLGKEFYLRTMPSIARALERIAESLERQERLRFEATSGKIKEEGNENNGDS